MTIVPNPAGQAAIDFALVNTGAAVPDIALLTSVGVSLARFTGRAPPPPGAPVVHLAGGNLVAAGDVDGDGVADLVVAGEAGFVVFHGQAVRP